MATHRQGNAEESNGRAEHDIAKVMLFCDKSSNDGKCKAMKCVAAA